MIEQAPCFTFEKVLTHLNIYSSNTLGFPWQFRLYTFKQSTYLYQYRSWQWHEIFSHASVSQG